MKSYTEDHFNKEYYQKFYKDGRTSVITQAQMTARANLIAAYATHVDCPVRSILDVGCGVGLLRVPLMRALPKARYTGVEFSAYLCKKYGWIQGNIINLKLKKPADLLVCYDVMQYLDDSSAARALSNFSKICRGILYFSALTRLDWKENADKSRTDQAVFMRSAQWYRTRLKKNFRSVGAGFWICRAAPLITWEMETAS